MSTTDTGTVVVGVDGSEQAARALEWAADEARLRGARVRAVTAWHVPATIYGAPGFVPPTAEPVEESFRKVAEEVAGEAVDRLREAGIDAEARVEQGQPADVLVRVAADADLLVVGSRGHGGFVGLLLGSVSAQCTHHSPCPLVVVR